MCDNNIEVIKDLGIYAITASITLNAGAFGIALANIEKLYPNARITLTKHITLSFWCFWTGISLAGIAILTTYCLAQGATNGIQINRFLVHMLLNVVPTFLSYLCFLLGAFILINNFSKSHLTSQQGAKQPKK